MSNRNDPFNYHFTHNTSRRPVYPSTPAPGSPPEFYVDENQQPILDPDFMLSLAATGDQGGYYTYTPPPPPLTLASRRSRPLWSNQLDFTPLPRHQARLQARDFRARRSDSRTLVVEEMEVNEDEEEGDEGLALRRMGPSVRRCGSMDSFGRYRLRRNDDDDDDDDDDDGERVQGGTVWSRAAEAANGSASEEQEQQQQQQQKDTNKRKLSEIFADAMADIGKVIKKRADSLVWRKDSGAELPEVLPQCSSEEIRISSGDAVLSRLQLRQASRQFDALRPSPVGESATSKPTRSSLCEQARRRISQIAPFGATVAEQLGRIHDNLPRRYSGPPNIRSEALRHAIARAESELLEEPQESSPRQRMVMMERQVRIAEREGAFEDAKRNKMYGKTYFHRCTERQQSQASAKLKEEVTKAQKKSDGQFWQGEEETSISPKGVWGRFRRWSRGDVDIARRADGRSTLVAAAEDPGYVCDDESASPHSGLRNERPRQDVAAAAARHARTALVSAPFIF